MANDSNWRPSKKEVRKQGEIVKQVEGSSSIFHKFRANVSHFSTNVSGNIKLTKMTRYVAIMVNIWDVHLINCSKGIALDLMPN